MVIGSEDRVKLLISETWLNILQTVFVLKVQVFQGVISIGKYFQMMYRVIAPDGVAVL